MSNIAKLLQEEIEATIQDVSNVQAGSEEGKAALVKLGRLHEQYIKELEADLKEQQRLDASLAKMDEIKLRTDELELRAKQAESEANLRKEELAQRIRQSEMEKVIHEAEMVQKEAELKEAKKSRRWRTVLEIFGITLPIAASGYWMAKGMKFEEEGKIYSSRTQQWVSNFLRLFKKG